MTIYNPTGNHGKYTETDRHFCPKSEVYTGADSLITAQRNGWRLINIVYTEDVQMRGGRTTTLYYFKLVFDDQKMIMPIVANPYVERMLSQRTIVLRSLTDRVANEAISQTVETTAIRVREA